MHIWYWVYRLCSHDADSRIRYLNFLEATRHVTRCSGIRYFYTKFSDSVYTENNSLLEFGSRIRKYLDMAEMEGGKAVILLQ